MSRKSGRESLIGCFSAELRLLQILAGGEGGYRDVFGGRLHLTVPA
jgi:hypothetical protein